jgi:hypothetical protein
VIPSTSIFLNHPGLQNAAHGAAAITHTGAQRESPQRAPLFVLVEDMVSPEPIITKFFIPKR